jgi:hypothetical protein
MEMRNQNGQLPVVFARFKDPDIFICCACDSGFPKNPLLGVAQVLYVFTEQNENGI